MVDVGDIPKHRENLFCLFRFSTSAFIPLDFGRDLFQCLALILGQESPELLVIGNTRSGAFSSFGSAILIVRVFRRGGTFKLFRVMAHVMHVLRPDGILRYAMGILHWVLLHLLESLL
jgi:hypothetical protein